MGDLRWVQSKIQTSSRSTRSKTELISKVLYLLVTLRPSAWMSMVCWCSQVLPLFSKVLSTMPTLIILQKVQLMPLLSKWAKEKKYPNPARWLLFFLKSWTLLLTENLCRTRISQSGPLPKMLLNWFAAGQTERTDQRMARSLNCTTKRAPSSPSFYEIFNVTFKFKQLVN